MPLGPNFDVGNTDGSEGFKIIGVGAGDQAGRNVASGDINGDGVADLVIGARYHDGAASDAGAAYVLFSPGIGIASGAQTIIDLSNLDASQGFRVDGINAGDRAGQQVAIGDLNGDGFGDILIGSPRGEGTLTSTIYNAGTVDIIFGSASDTALTTLDAADGAADRVISVSQLDGADGFRLEGQQAGNSLGGLGRSRDDALDTGDINGDGLDDIIVGNSTYTSPGRTDSGAAFVLFGKAAGFDRLISTNGFDGADGFRLKGEATEDQVGDSVALIDINGDGFDDAVVGAPKDNPYGTNAGRVHVFFGRSNQFQEDQDLASVGGFSGFEISGPQTFTYMGSSVAAGDINGDGIQDFVVGMSNADFGGGNTGGVAVFFGGFGPSDAPRLSTLNGANGFRIDGGESGEQIGTAIGVADVNGDGVDDILIGNYALGSDREFVVYGKPQGESFSAVFNTSQINGENGFAIDPEDPSGDPGRNLDIADVNNDGFADLLIGDGKADDAAADAGAVQIIFGGATKPVNRNGDGQNNVLVGAGFSDVMNGAAGDDTISGFAGDDIIGGDDGDDTLNGGDGDDELRGGAGNDAIEGGAGDDTIRGGSGNDALNGGAGNDHILGGSGNDSFGRVEGRDVYDGGDGFDAYEDDELDSNQRIEAKLQNGTIQRLSSVDNESFGVAKVFDIEEVLAGAGDDLLIAGDDAVTFRGGEGADTLFGGLGDDELHGEGGDDNIQGQLGDDDLFGGAGEDFLRGGSGDDQLFGGDEADSGQGDSGVDTILGGDGDDLFFGGVGNDSMFGGEGDDALRGDTQNDTLRGEAGDDSLKGGSGDDTLEGGANRDTLLGENGADRLTGGLGIDLITGGAGADTFVAVTGMELDKVFDFEDGVDLLDFSDHANVTSFSDLTVTAFNVGQDTKVAVTAAPTDFFVLVGLPVGNFDANDLATFTG